MYTQKYSKHYLEYKIPPISNVEHVISRFLNHLIMSSSSSYNCGGNRKFLVNQHYLPREEAVWEESLY